MCTDETLSHPLGYEALINIRVPKAAKLRWKRKTSYDFQSRQECFTHPRDTWREWRCSIWGVGLNIWGLKSFKNIWWCRTVCAAGKKNNQSGVLTNNGASWQQSCASYWRVEPPPPGEPWQLSKLRKPHLRPVWNGGETFTVVFGLSFIRWRNNVELMRLHNNPLSSSHMVQCVACSESHTHYPHSHTSCFGECEGKKKEERRSTR